MLCPLNQPRFHSCTSKVNLPHFSKIEKGNLGTFEYRMFITANGVKVSPWHSIPLRSTNQGNVVNMICEIPRGTNHKIEICTKEHFNPLKQDVKKNALRYLKYGNVICNYGAISQTYEDPKAVNALTGIVGDNDPLDVLEISETPMERGQVAQVKVLGSLALIDDGETDWKIIVVDTKNPLAEKLNTIADVERLLPGRVGQLREWYRVYKTAEGKGLNKYAFDGKAIDSAETVKVIDDSHQQWHKLVADKANRDKAGIGRSLITLPEAKKALNSIPRI